MVTADCQVSRRKRVVVDWAGFGEAIAVGCGGRGWAGRAVCIQIRSVGLMDVEK